MYPTHLTGRVYWARSKALGSGNGFGSCSRASGALSYSHAAFHLAQMIDPVAQMRRTQHCLLQRLP